VKLDPDKVALPPAPQITSLHRNPRIRLFEMEIPSERTASSPQTAPATAEPKDPTETVDADATIASESLKQQL
jgi:hypothetical protein